MILPLFAVALLITGADDPGPKPELGPGDVVWIQIEALRNNDRKGKDTGIATVFRFASPGNQEVTGPLAHFIEILKTPGYQPLINHRIAGVGPIIRVGDVAVQRVTVIAADGRAIEYEFRLSKDPKTRCWGTEGVAPVAEPGPRPNNQVI